MHAEPTELQVLDRDECFHLLATMPIGRIVFTDRAMPAVLPVNFIVDNDEIVIRTGTGSKLSAAVRNAIVAFEVDEFDLAAHTGWSVTVTGRAREVTDAADVQRLSESALRTWAPGQRDHFVRITAGYVSGRRVALRAVDRAPEAAAV